MFLPCPRYPGLLVNFDGSIVLQEGSTEPLTGKVAANVWHDGRSISRKRLLDDAWPTVTITLDDYRGRSLQAIA